MAHAPLPADTEIGRICLRVGDLERSLSFYRDLLGFAPLPHGEDAARVALSATGREPACLLLVESPGADPKPRRTLGLYHFAVLAPDRGRLAGMVARLVAAGWPLVGASDHGVSEAVYLADPDGIGVELYADRPRERWPYREDGAVAMVTRPLDVRALLAAGEGSGGLHPQTRVGHVHLHVSDLDRAEAFYSDLIGLEVTQRDYPGARFLAAGGYHHHLGLNAWAGGSRPPAEAAGLIDFAIRAPEPAAAAAVERLRAAGCDVAGDAGDWRAFDPDANGVRLEASRR